MAGATDPTSTDMIVHSVDACVKLTRFISCLSACDTCIQVVLVSSRA
eukprot:SAG25_NODE_542_length_7058_cov_1.916942_8_plen_47_part_00